MYYITDHYLGSAAVLVRLAKIVTDDLHDVLEKSWRRIATKRDKAAYDAQS